MTDQDILDEYGENYPPGFLAAGIVAVREWLLEIGNPRRDQDEVKRLRSAGELRVSCPLCDGRGRIMRWDRTKRDCWLCGGRGWFYSGTMARRG